MAVRIITLDEELGAAAVGPVFLCMFYGPPTVPVLARLETVQRAAMGTTRYGVLSLIDPRVGLKMDAEARARAKDLGAANDAYMVCNVFFVKGTGFFAAMVRSVIAGVQLISSTRYPWKVASEIDDALAFLATAMAKERMSIDTEEVRGAMTTLLAGPRKDT